MIEICCSISSPIPLGLREERIVQRGPKITKYFMKMSFFSLVYIKFLASEWKNKAGFAGVKGALQSS